MAEARWGGDVQPRPLVCGFNGSLANPSDRVRALASNIGVFQATFRELEIILKTGGTAVERIDEFRQTLDECDDFLFDYQDLQNGKLFDKRPPPLPDIQYRMPRYVYTDSDIAALERRIEKQLQIMRAKMDYVNGLSDDPLELQSLLASFSEEPPFFTRKRIYMETPSSSPLPEIIIQNTRHRYTLCGIELLNSGGRRLLISTSNDERTRIVHHLPSEPNVYPWTVHRKIDPSVHDTEVSIIEPCFVEVIGGESKSLRDKIPLYRFPLPLDALSFQSSLRGKYIRDTFDVDLISSKKDKLASYQHLKLWSDFDGRTDYLTFYRHKGSPAELLEFPLDWFEPTPWINRKHPKIVHLHFCPARRKKSRSSSFTASLVNFSRRHSEISICSSTSGTTSPRVSAESESGITTPASSKDTPIPYMKGRAMDMSYLQIEFSDEQAMNSFKRRFREVHDKFGGAVTSNQEHSPGERETAHPAAKKPPRSDRSNKGVIVEESPPENDHVYRVQGIPIKFEVEDVKKLLRLVLDLEASSSIEIRSLAIHHEQTDRVAIVSFNPAPSSLRPLSLGNKEESWKFKYGYGEGAERRDRNVSFDIHFRGPTVLRSCPNGEDHRIDICAVSGLGGHAYGSFKERSGSYMWLVDSLPQELRFARIMTFGFDTKLPNSQSTQDMKDLASFLFQNLEPITERATSLETSGNVPSLPDVQKGRVRLPLIFIAHSLGGLVVKEAMLYAKNKGRTRFLESIYGGLFFGVPSRGMDISAIVPMVEGQPNEALLKSIDNLSPILRDQSKRFRDAFRDQLRIIYFYETQNSPTYKFDKGKGKWIVDTTTQLLVDRVSATDGRYWDNQEGDQQDTYPLNKNHSNLVKFTEYDEYYPAVRDTLKDMVSTALSNSSFSSSSFSSPPPSPPSSREEGPKPKPLKAIKTE